jgi:hypothetical protein
VEGSRSRSEWTNWTYFACVRVSSWSRKTFAVFWCGYGIGSSGSGGLCLRGKAICQRFALCRFPVKSTSLLWESLKSVSVNIASQPQSANGAIPSRLWMRSSSLNTKAITAMFLMQKVPRPMAFNIWPLAARKIANGLRSGCDSSTLRAKRRCPRSGRTAGGSPHAEQVLWAHRWSCAWDLVADSKTYLAQNHFPCACFWVLGRYRMVLFDHVEILLVGDWLVKFLLVGVSFFLVFDTATDDEEF